jgi:hypothetical protein
LFRASTEIIFVQVFPEPVEIAIRILVFQDLGDYVPQQ